MASAHGYKEPGCLTGLDSVLDFSCGGQKVRLRCRDYQRGAGERGFFAALSLVQELELEFHELLHGDERALLSVFVFGMHLPDEKHANSGVISEIRIHS